MEGIDYNKRYNEISKEFRNTNASKESVEKLYDLLYELKKIERSHSENMILCFIYKLLGYHQSAYKIFANTADMNNKKNKAKLLVMKDKATSHKDTFIIQDIRKFQKKQPQAKISLQDFVPIDNDENDFTLTNKSLVVFNKKINNKRIEFHLGNHELENYIDDIIKKLEWLSDCKEELICYYNRHLAQYTNKQANENWYHTLEVLSLKVTIGESGNIFADISCGEDYMLDHILDVETNEREIYDMRFDG
ncbi:hypothetical protein [Aquimarina algicola]|uniref:Uncharacterized protein n=1 Tax=Aquimarina algicola TaxID=2589995 RepID=A0A504JCE5_9FLAO|nr:hypothetical protein [Aquimarina algicola]TPN85253.1 hypothetical protein FHK87_14605 [Aquimarina algicola]